MSIQEYKRKRNFAATPEPAKAGARASKHCLFVVQLHHASRRHYDFRLELDGTLKSWAVPKGPSFDPAVKRLAVEVEDHPVSYADFEGDIAKGNYGAGHVDIFDHGTWEPIGNARAGLKNGELKFILHGDVLRGSWVLVRTRKQGSKQQWLLIKHHDEFAGTREADDSVDAKTDRPIALAQRRKTWRSPALAKATSKTKSVPQKAAPTKTRVPTRPSAKPADAKAEPLRDAAFAPELCKAQRAPPQGDHWLHEVKWDGYRIVATVVKGKVRLWSRNAIEWTAKLPELAAAVASLKLKSAQLDGEMIVLRNGRDDFNALQGRLSAENKEPALYMLFDLPYLNGLSYRGVALTARKARLEALLDAHPHPLLRYSEHQIGSGSAIFSQAIKSGLEGIVSKRTDSGYSGTRNGDWIKVKGRPSDEFVVIGYTEPKGARAGIGALLLGTPIKGGYRYVGRVGTGIGDTQLRALRKSLSAAVVEDEPADTTLLPRKDRKSAIWVKPERVIEVYYQGIGGQGLLRQPAFKALREDKGPADLRAPLGAAKSRATTRRAALARNREPAAEDVVITHPQREAFPGTGITKGDVAAYYRAAAARILPEISDRPLSVVRCPDGTGKACFFQKHIGTGWGEHVHGVKIKEKNTSGRYLYINGEAGLLELVQMNVLEIHPWGAYVDDPDHADRIVFDLDPHAAVKWLRVIAAAREVRKQLDSIGLQSFVRTSGGKGLHVVVPLNPPAPWDAVRAFAQGVASALAELHPDEFVAVAGEKNRTDKIFVDWLRNGLGATSVASYSLRARAHAGIAMPLAWEEIGRVKSGDAFTIRNAARRFSKSAKDPWTAIGAVKQALPDMD